MLHFAPRQASKATRRRPSAPTVGPVRRSLSVCLAGAATATALIVGALTALSLHRAPARGPHLQRVAAQVSIPAPGRHRVFLRLPKDWGIEAGPVNGILSLGRSDTCAHASLLAIPAPAGPPDQAALKLLGQIEGRSYDPSALAVGRARLAGADQELRLAVQAPLQAVVLAHRDRQWTAIVIQASFPQRCRGPQDAGPLLRALLAGRLGDEPR
jgi:hypothetical protein